MSLRTGWGDKENVNDHLECMVLCPSVDEELTEFMDMD